jgi:hypothetical protein
MACSGAPPVDAALVTSMYWVSSKHGRGTLSFTSLLFFQLDADYTPGKGKRINLPKRSNSARADVFVFRSL